MKVNDPVWVRLTPHGEAHLERYYQVLGTSFEPAMSVDNQGDRWWRFPFWHFIYIFGEMCVPGAPIVLVEDEVRVQEPGSNPSEPAILHNQPFWKFRCSKCTAWIQAGIEHVQLGFFGANYGGDKPEGKYYVQCPNCGNVNFVPSDKLNAKVMEMARRRHTASNS